MSNTITIEPVTRIEGHAKVTLHLNDEGEVYESFLHVVEFRGFEKFCEGRLMSEMPVITTRVCGICPVSHHLASAKACDDLLKVDIPPTAKKLRELMHMGQTIHSHALHFFFLASPDLVLGPMADPGRRNIFGVIDADSETAKKAIRLRQIGQNIIESVGGRAIHPVTAIPGGVSKPLSHKERYTSSKEVGEAVELAKIALDLGRSLYDKYPELSKDFALFRTKHMGLVKNGSLELYDGLLRLVDEDGNRLEEFDPCRYDDYLSEHVEDWSYMKFPYYTKQGYPDGIYRVGPLARLNVAEGIATPLAGAELAQFRKFGNGGLVHNTFYYHYARLIELLYAVERAGQLLADDDIVGLETRVPVDRGEGEGVGVIEAPRGTLMHHYWADDGGKIVKADFIVATTHNNPAMNRSVNEVAKKYVKGGEIQEGALNMVEMAIRCYDPCLSCATHAAGKMPLLLQLVGPDGTIVDSVQRRA